MPAAQCCRAIVTIMISRERCTKAALVVVTASVCAAMAGCGNTPSKDELEAAKNTIACEYTGERLVIRFLPGEARMLMADGTRVTLHQIDSGSGVRYSNGLVELRGKGMDLQLIRNDVSILLVGCAQYTPPAK
jgi:membrane-bound inhibitor of C-type lysozyme